MKLVPMRYKDYTWPHNPETCRVELGRKIAVQKVPFGAWFAQDLGAVHRVIRGEGVFAGEGAYEEFRRLEAVFRQSGPGLLVHPVWQSMQVHFAVLEVREEPRPDYVRYAFEFWEEGGASALKLLAEAPEQTENTAVPTPAAAYHTVRKGDTLWGISRQYGVSLGSIIALNPGIKNPNLIYPGNEVRVR